jgi:hypothetical protein
MQMALSADVFQDQFRLFSAAIEKASNAPFVSFEQGLAATWESYKPALHAKAVRTMGVDKWDASSIGNGEILEAVISAIELPDNNLVRWPNQYGHANRSHRALIDARLNPRSRHVLEGWLFNFYKGLAEPGEAFEEFRRLAGSRYDLLAYMFFLRDMEKYMPIATRTFDEAFRRLGIDVVTTQRCSWENYCQYNDALREVETALVQHAGLAKARLIDAHSFCWILVRVELELSPGTGNSNADPTKSSKGRVLDGREKAIWQMVRNAEGAARTSGAVEEVLRKIKEVRINQLEFKEYVDALLKRQEEKCALTGIPFQLPGDNSDLQLAPSLDRIDSNGHYEKGNLQIVCRFINFWKGSDDNEEFRRLLAIVRGDDF